MVWHCDVVLLVVMLAIVLHAVCRWPDADADADVDADVDADADPRRSRSPALLLILRRTGLLLT